MATCKLEGCDKELNIKEIERVYSESLADSGYCTPQCYTKAIQLKRVVHQMDLEINDRDASIWKDGAEKYFVTFALENGERNKPKECFHNTAEAAIEAITKATEARFELDGAGVIRWEPGDCTRYEAMILDNPHERFKKQLIAFRVGGQLPFVLFNRAWVEGATEIEMSEQMECYKFDCGKCYAATAKSLIGLVKYMKEKGV